MPGLRSMFRKPGLRGPDGPADLPIIQRAGAYSRLDLKRPAVLRKGNSVKTCYLYEGTKQCLGDSCFWPRAGKCSIFDKLFKTKNGKRKAN